MTRTSVFDRLPTPEPWLLDGGTVYHPGDDGPVTVARLDTDRPNWRYNAGTILAAPELMTIGMFLLYAYDEAGDRRDRKQFLRMDALRKTLERAMAPVE